MKTFELNKAIRNNATRVLINAGVDVRTAINMIREKLPYLFATKKQIEQVENSWNF